MDESPLPGVYEGFRTTQRRHTHPWHGVHRLMHAILVDAALCLQKSTREKTGCAQRALHQETLDWFIGTTTKEYPFGFVAICEELGLDAASVRKRALSGEWKADAAQKQAKNYAKLRATMRK